MHQRGGLQRVAGGFLSHFMRRQFAEFLIDQREELLSRFTTAFLDALEDLGDIAHATELKRPRAIEEAERRGMSASRQGPARYSKTNSC